ncbi:MAG: nucleotidyl transferase AbiEii/AbiGii toxin family protein [Ignavibacteria bacterium]|nr:nucleotidyl transferase AbiEii/AbiGii toxin family protein [Ignavibacteria bacterium]
MIKKSFDISGKIDKYRLEIIALIKEAADSLDIPFFIVGATARDIILEYIYNKKIFRATNDIDFGIQINNWKILESFSSLLLNNKKFSPDEKVEHRFLYEKAYPVDIVPFGKIASENGIFKWPKDKKEFTVLGFEEAYENSDLVKVKSNPDLIINFAIPQSLALLKIVVWNERYPERSKDALDLVLLIESYLEAGNIERLYEEEADLVDENFDFNLTGARLLGRDIATVFKKNTLSYVIKILDIETGKRKRYRMIEDMMRKHNMKEDIHFEYYLNILEELKAGIQERLINIK